MNNFHSEGGWKGPAPLPRLLNLPSHHVSRDCLGRGKGTGSDTLKNLFFLILVKRDGGFFVYLFFLGWLLQQLVGALCDAHPNVTSHI